ncbi:MAG: hypothetical protein M5U34_10665 [Chloroflexi bacterium]|nr:hypothetical protein [Chloroflexota bacterium]
MAALALTWLVTAVVSDQVNLWLLIIVLHLQMNVPRWMYGGNIVGPFP